MFYINFFGTGIRYTMRLFSNDLFEGLKTHKEDKNMSWDDLFNDLHLLADLGIHDMEELSKEHESIGLLLGGKNIIEIRKDGRRLKRIFTSEFNDPYNLLDPYNRIEDTSELELNTDLQRVVFVQVETGLIAKFEIDSEDFVLDDVTFLFNYKPLSDFHKEDWICGIYYRNIPVKSSKDDTVVMSQHVLLL